ncbi:MAG TPA: chemotaxis protein CheB [Gammaproteobacteria bacterium]
MALYGVIDTRDTRPLRVAIAHHDGEGRCDLARLLEACGLDVVLNTAFVPGLPKLLVNNRADVLLVDLEDGEALHKDYLDALFEQLDMPIVFSDKDVTMKNGQTDEEIGRKLSNKLTSLFSRGGNTGKAPVDNNKSLRYGIDILDESTTDGAGLSRHDENITASTHRPRKEDVPASRVWVLIGSIGSVAAIRRFLAALPPDLPIAFIVAQQICESIVMHASRLIALDATFHVLPARVGHVINHHEVIMLPVVDESLIIGDRGQIGLVPPVAVGDISPAIDKVLSMVAKRYQANAGVIIFSGIGKTGIEGCNAIIDHGGAVWTQDAESCQFDSMPQYVREACKVSYTAAPEVLARQLTEDLDSVVLKRASRLAR